MSSFSSKILDWHTTVDRDMPWKETNDPYKIWISEVILQQTRVAQGKDYYLRFIDKFPDVRSLARADQSEVLKQWEGLGYYSRARNLHHAAQQVVNDFNGRFPDNYDDILSLKGIGPYTAAAIASFAFNLRHAVVDGNVIRVLSRHFGMSTPFDTTSGKKEFQKLAQSLIQKVEPADYNQAIMDFGALVCTPRATKCDECPIKDSCEAYDSDMVYTLPIKSKKVEVKQLHVYYILHSSDNNIIIRQRSQKGIWAGLYELPGIESDQPLALLQIRQQFGISTNIKLKKIQEISHKLTHRQMTIHIYQSSDVPHEMKLPPYELQRVKELHTFAFPKPLKNWIKSHFQL